jgi:hypothetical protein
MQWRDLKQFTRSTWFGTPSTVGSISIPMRCLCQYKNINMQIKWITVETINSLFLYLGKYSTEKYRVTHPGFLDSKIQKALFLSRMLQDVFFESFLPSVSNPLTAGCIEKQKSNPLMFLESHPSKGEHTRKKDTVRYGTL